MQQRRFARLLLALVLAAAPAAGLAACGGGSKAGDGITSPPSTSK